MELTLLEVKTKVVDEFGGEYPEALTVAHAFSESSQTTGYCEQGQNKYTIEANVEAITYKVNYWYNEQTKASGKRTRQLCQEVDGKFTAVFNVDLENPEVERILASEMEHHEKILAAVKADITRKFN